MSAERHSVASSDDLGNLDPASAAGSAVGARQRLEHAVERSRAAELERQLSRDELRTAIRAAREIGLQPDAIAAAAGLPPHQIVWMLARAV